MRNNNLRFQNMLKNYYFPIFCSLATSIYFLQLNHIPLPDWVNNYINDFLCLPIVLFICQYAVGKVKSNGEIKIPAALIFLVASGYALYFEYLLPRINSRYTADIFDVILYFAGAALYFVLHKSGDSKDKYDQMMGRLCKETEK